MNTRCGLAGSSFVYGINRIAWLAAATPLFVCVPASAAVPDAGASSVLEEVIVTARRREENLQSTPVAISAFTAASLERQQIFSTEDLDRVTPNLQFTGYGPLTGNNSAAQVFIRGIGQTDASSGVDPGVGLYIDDVYMGRAVGGAMEFRDTAGVQVLRGPQGTLFGRNTVGGAVLMTTTAPGDSFGGTVRAGVGEDNLRQVFGALNAPIADGLAARVSFGTKKRDGYVRRIVDGVDLGNENTYTGQAAVRWMTDRLTLTLRGDYTKSDEHGSPFVFEKINTKQAFPAAASRGAGCPSATFPPPNVPEGVVDTRCANNATWNLGHYTNGGTAPQGSSLKSWGTSVTAQLKMNDVFALKAITAYRELDWFGARDADNTPFVILDTQYQTGGHQFSQELQALFDWQRFKGVIGAFYFKEKYDDFLQVRYAAPPPLVASGASPGSRDHEDAVIDNHNWALFSQWTYNVSDALSMTGGIRHTAETKGIDITAFSVQPYTAPDPASPTLYILPQHFERTFKSTTGSVTVQYQWMPRLMTYVGWSQGFKSGGFNQRYNAAPVGNLPVDFNPEKATNYEVGVKSEFTRIARVNLAVFHTQYQNMQLIYRNGLVPLIYNGGKSSIDGAELEFTLAPGNLILEGSVGYLHNKYDEVVVIPNAAATVGKSNKLPFTPEWQANLGIGYDFHLGGDTLTLTPRIDVSYTGKHFFDATNSPEVAELDNVTVVNASLSLATPQKWRVTAGVDNVTDKEYKLAGNSSYATSAGYAEAVYARPRNWFVRASYDF